MTHPLRSGFDIDEELIALDADARDDDTLRELPVVPSAQDYAKAYADALHRVLHRDAAYRRIFHAIRDENRALRREIAALRSELTSERIAAQTERHASSKRHVELLELLKHLRGYAE